MTEPVRTVLVVGGGTSGWMTAAYLHKVFGPQVQVTLVESSLVPKIGVGEATVPNLQASFFDVLGIPEATWMREVNGAFKCAIRYVNWRPRQAGESDNHFYHPFGVLPYCDGVHLPLYWNHLRATEGAGPFAYDCFLQPPLLDAKKAPKFFDGLSVMPHAWHFDAHKVAAFLCRWAVERGVAHIVDDVLRAEPDAAGGIAAVHTATGRRLEADLFVDCTGFRGLLINEALGEPFLDMKDHLLCDSAVAAVLPHDDDAHGVDPYTSAIAGSAGWTWKIPMLGRFGTGYVYASRFQSADDATREFCALWGVSEKVAKPRHIRFRTGRNRRAWVGNCVSIGLSSCFLEPLESTGIYFITAAIHQLAKHFPSRAMEPGLVDAFNREVEFMFDDCRDFVQAHYFTTQRDDTAFWRTNKHELVVSDSMRAKMADFAAGLPVNAPWAVEEDYYQNLDSEFRQFWQNGNYYAVLAGMGHLPDQPLRRLAYRPDAVAEARALLGRVKARQSELLAALPSNVDYLRAFHAGRVGVR